MIRIYENIDDGFKFSNKNTLLKIFYETLGTFLDAIRTGGNSTRGEGVATNILCQLFSAKLNDNIKCENYVLHHKNYKHNDNNLNNLVLISKTADKSHSKLHRNAVYGTVKYFIGYYNFISNNKDDKENLYIQGRTILLDDSEIGIQNQEKLRNLLSNNVDGVIKIFLDILEKQTVRSRRDNTDYLFVSDLL